MYNEDNRKENGVLLWILMITCIYCRTSSAAPYPKEHVLPRAFGAFRENLTLESVCGSCNTYFARELELFLARDSVEALLRIRNGIKIKSGRRKIGVTRLVIRVTSTGEWYGARVAVERNHTGSAMTAEPLPQVAFRKHGETDWNWFLEEELDQTQSWERFRTDTDTKIVGKPDAVIRRIVGKMVQLGIVFKKLGTFEKHGGDVGVYAEATLDDTIFRGADKIALNFLAYLRGAEFALRPDFDPIRDFVRLGKRAGLPFVIATTIPILHGDDALYRQTNGHVIVLDWDNKQKGIVCLVSLFNHLTYHVALCTDYNGLWHPLSGGRHFDLQTLSISELRGTNLISVESSTSRTVL